MGISSQIKLYLLGVWAIVTTAFAALFFYERNKAQVNQSLADQAVLNTQLTKQDGQIGTNGALLKVEEDKRAVLEKEINSNASPEDLVKYLNSKSE